MNEEKILKRIKRPSAVNCDDFSDNTELFILRVPNGIVDLKDLINEEIELSSKKTTTIKIIGKTLELAPHATDGQDVFPWISNSKGILTKSNLPIKGDFYLRLPLNHTQEQIAVETVSVQHKPPSDLKERNFFGNHFGSSNKSQKKMKFETTSPGIEVKATKKRKKEGDKLQTQFNGISKDICTTPNNLNSSKSRNSCTPSKSTKKSKKSK